MTARIDTAEIVSFRLKVPRMELERLPPSPAGQELGVSIEHEQGELVVSARDGDSHLRFRPIGAEAVLVEIFVSRDPNGDFFLRVLGPLMVRFAGDLLARVVWSVPERNVNGDHAEVRVARGLTDYPGLGHVPLTESAAQAGAGGGGASRNELRAGPEELGEQVPAKLAHEVQELLDRGRQAYEEYLRLKKAREK